MHGKKAQVFSMDAVASLMIFLGVVSLAMFFWIYSPVQDSGRQRAESVADYLLMKRLGYENKLDYLLIGNFTSQSYEEMRQELGVPENFYFKILNTSSFIISAGGMQPAESAGSIMNIRRIGVLGGNYVYLDTILWE